RLRGRHAHGELHRPGAHDLRNEHDVMRLRATVLLLSIGRIAAADDVDVKRADELFARAQDMREHGDHAGACKLFEESLAKNPHAVGTVLNVALCDEENGHIASAIRRFTEARARAVEQDLAQHRTAAETHLATLASRVAHLSIAFTTKPAGTRLVVD